MQNWVKGACQNYRTQKNTLSWNSVFSCLKVLIQPFCEIWTMGEIPSPYQSSRCDSKKNSGRLWLCQKGVRLWTVGRCSFGNTEAQTFNGCKINLLFTGLREVPPRPLEIRYKGYGNPFTSDRRNTFTNPEKSVVLVWRLWDSCKAM